MANPRSKSLDAAIAAITVGMLIMIIGAVGAVQQFSFSRQAVTTTATVVGYEKEQSCSRRRHCSTYYPATVEFITTDGRHIRTTLTSSHNSEIPTNGTVLSIEYRRDQPEIAQASEDQTVNWVVPAILSGVGFIALICGAIVMIVRNQRQSAALR